MSGDGIDGVLELVDTLQSRVAALEAQAKAAAEVKPSGDVQALRAMAVKLSRQLAAKRVARRSDANRAYWLKTFAAAALPTAMLQVSTTRHAAQLAADTAFELLQIIEQGIDQAAEESDDEREKPETAE